MLTLFLPISAGLRAIPVWPPAPAPPPLRNLTNHGAWTDCAEPGEVCFCAGYVRERLSNASYTAPVVVDVSVNCSGPGLQSYLWSDFNATKGKCERLNHKKLIFSTQAGCMQIGEPADGWPGPGVRSECGFEGWVYHKTSGQIRSRDRCVTAIRSKNTTAHAPWWVTLLPCSNEIRSAARQAWDLPENVLTKFGLVPEVNYN